MNRRFALLVIPALALAGTAASSVAAPPKGFTKTVTYTDATPDPSGNALGSGNENHCNGALPREAPIEVKIPAAGTLKVDINGFVGDWTLQIQDASGKTIGGADVNPPNEFESASVKLKKAATVKIAPCNIGGTPQAQVTYTYTPKK